MPLLYRLLMRLAAVAAMLGILAGLGFSIGLAKDLGAQSLILGVAALIPAAALYALAWIVRPPLDAQTRQRLWRE
jgi:hypothetical protein